MVVGESHDSGEAHFWAKNGYFGELPILLPI